MGGEGGALALEAEGWILLPVVVLYKSPASVGFFTHPQNEKL